MAYRTDRKTAEGLGSGHAGTHHHWQMMISSMALVFVVPIFLVTFSLGFGGSYEEVIAYFGHPLPAIITALSLIVVVLHVMNEALVAVEDYVHGVPGYLTQVAVKWLAYILIAVGLFAIARLAL
ncbi:MAG: succinate dehydrogenase, hydrophobic membrane anchor protein [Pseudomonadota bacterium]